MKIKICGLFRECDIDYANETGPDYIGFILHFPKSHRNIDVETAALLKSRLSSDIKAVGVFVDQNIGTVTDAAERIPLDVIQLHGSEDDAYIQTVKERTGLPVWKAFKVREEADLEAAQRSTADEILLDSGYGTGKSFDWSKTEHFTRPFILAGGLTPENIPDAASLSGVKMLDISSGIETEKVKDRTKIIAAVQAAHNKKEGRQ